MRTQLSTVHDFVDTVMAYYKTHGRHDLPWRQMKEDKNGEHDPYKILVSEMMLQQTQVSRVIPKYEAFLRRFPTVETLAVADLGEVYALWQGLGYNRRARFLRDTARAIFQQVEQGRTLLKDNSEKLSLSEVFPKEIEELEKLPGIGPYTARAIYTFAYNKPCVLIETNVRACVLHHFFPKAKKGQVSDIRIEKIMRECIAYIDAETKTRLLFNNHSRPWREWYSALMDYGTHLKETQPNPSRKSRTHVVQKKFIGSIREVRGEIMRQLVQSIGNKVHTSVIYALPFEDERIRAALEGLTKDKMIVLHTQRGGDTVHLAR